MSYARRPDDDPQRLVEVLGAVIGNDYSLSPKKDTYLRVECLVMKTSWPKPKSMAK